MKKDFFGVNKSKEGSEELEIHYIAPSDLYRVDTDIILGFLSNKGECEVCRKHF